MAVVRKLQSKIVSIKKDSPRVLQSEESKEKNIEPLKVEVSVEEKEGVSKRMSSGKKVCFFCKSGSEPHYWDAAALRRYINDRGRIYPRSRSGSCAKHQRKVSRAIKHARHLALLSFISRA